MTVRVVSMSLTKGPSASLLIHCSREDAYAWARFFLPGAT
jgi:hypothetical protein